MDFDFKEFERLKFLQNLPRQRLGVCYDFSRAFGIDQNCCPYCHCKSPDGNCEFFYLEDENGGNYRVCCGVIKEIEGLSIKFEWRRRS